MASKPKKQADPVMDDIKARRAHQIEARTPEEARRVIASDLASPELAAARAIQAIEGGKGIGEHLDTPEMIKCLREQAATVTRGNLAQAEAMLMNQATTLQSLFARLTERAMEQTHMPNLEGFMRMALRAQSQCRATLETLAAIKNPPIVYARQANVTTGPQQINNGTATPSRMREIETEQSQLSEGTHELLPDARASGNASRVNPTLETLGEIDRAEVPRG